MATVSELGETWNTTAGNKTVVATPAVNDLIVIVAGMSGWASGDDITLADNNADGLGAYTKFGTATVPLSTGGGTACALWFFVRNALIGSATSTTFTATISGDTGGGLTAMKVTGMVRVGVNAVRQAIGQSTQTENPPSIAFGVATLANYPLIVAVMGEDAPLALTPPTGFTETTEGSWATPTTGINVAFLSAGSTGSTYAWSAGAVTDHNEIAVELDSSVPQEPPSLFMAPYRHQPRRI